MATTLVNRVRTNTGAYTSSDELIFWLNRGIKEIMSGLSTLKKHKYAFLTDATDGLSMADHEVLSFSYDDLPGRIITADKKGYADSDSIFAGNTLSPVGWYLDETFYTEPNGCFTLAIRFDKIEEADETIAYFPQEYEEGPILYASFRALMVKAKDLLDTTIGGLSWSSQVAPSAPSSPSFTITDAGPSPEFTASITFNDTLSFTPPAIEFDVTNIGTALTEEDLALTQAEGTKLGLQLQKAETDIKNAMGTFSEDLEKYKAGLQEAIELARQELQAGLSNNQLEVDLSKYNEGQKLQKQIAEYQADLQLHSSEVAVYQANIGQEAQKNATLLSNARSRLESTLPLIQSYRAEYNSILKEAGQ